MVVKMSAPGRSFGGVADYCLHDRWVPGQEHPESAERVEWTETRNLATEQGDRAARIMAATAEASSIPGVETPGGRGSDRTKAREAGVTLLAELGQGGEAGPARDAAGCGGEPEGAGDGEAPGADRVSPGRATPRARDREPGGAGEREGGGVEPEQAAPLEVGGKV